MRACALEGPPSRLTSALPMWWMHAFAVSIRLALMILTSVYTLASNDSVGAGPVRRKPATKNLRSFLELLSAIGALSLYEYRSYGEAVDRAAQKGWMRVRKRVRSTCKPDDEWQLFSFSPRHQHAPPQCLTRLLSFTKHISSDRTARL
jgi:hypothetical protein